MIKAVYSEMDGPAGVTRRLSVQGHAGYAPAGQDIVCAGASILMQALVWMAADIEGAECMAAVAPERVLAEAERLLRRTEPGMCQVALSMK